MCLRATSLSRIVLVKIYYKNVAAEVLTMEPSPGLLVVVERMHLRKWNAVDVLKCFTAYLSERTTCKRSEKEERRSVQYAIDSGARCDRNCVHGSFVNRKRVTLVKSVAVVQVRSPDARRKWLREWTSFLKCRHRPKDRRWRKFTNGSW